jgi:hypothetical protein
MRAEQERNPIPAMPRLRQLKAERQTKAERMAAERTSS